MVSNYGKHDKIVYMYMDRFNQISIFALKLGLLFSRLKRELVLLINERNCLPLIFEILIILKVNVKSNKISLGTAVKRQVPSSRAQNAKTLPSNFIKAV